MYLRKQLDGIRSSVYTEGVTVTTPKTLLCLALLISTARCVLSQNQAAPACPNGTESSLAFTLTDGAGEFLADVKKDDLTLRINGNLTPILRLDLQAGLPVDLAILIDVSVSQERALSLSKPAANVLIQQLLRSSKNRVALLSFSNQIEVEKLLTSDVSLLLAALDEVKVVHPAGYIGGGIVVSGQPPPRNSRFPGSTSLWDTATATMESIFFSARDEGRRRAVVLMTDGEDTASHGKPNAAIESALDHGVAVYSIGLENGDLTVNRDSLKKISEETGGTAAFPKKREDVIAALVEIQNRLASQWMVSFCRDPKKTRDALKVRLDFANSKFRDARLAYRRH